MTEWSKICVALRFHRNTELFCFFDDATLADIGLKGITKVFDRKMAYFILESIEEALKNTEITHILVHCSAGISRSAAVSRILNDFVNSVLSENETDWEYNDKHGFELPPTPNPPYSQQ